ncbi:MAG: DEAD/DEAH box helicase [Salinivirgaceae bacterium]|nr:DEAD/DEAH box helicase [Salinivirgaceae bacterium]MDD4746902.1 DEAD/DEAH box helicase [Salinivirgaceae bacterium]MDY0280990.1 DEAD/DEAH box helicase [Salinivirgaceae bacterium]
MESFLETGLSKDLLDAIQDLGFVTPTPIQAATIPVLLSSDKDVVALAQTGTGKTAAFGLPAIELTDSDFRNVQTIILCPTRELCLQITKDLNNYAQFVKALRITAVYGGANIVAQIQELKRGSHIVVGTPGRVIDLIKRGALKLQYVRRVVLDEADEMLNMGFVEDLDTILAETPKEKQTWLFSATMPSEISRIAKKYMNDPVEISVGKRNQGADNVQHDYYLVQARDKYAALKRICDIHPDIYGIVFCRTRHETKEIAESLMNDGYNADALHGDLSQAQRDYVMSRFRVKHLQILVATDVAARGIDIDNLSHIINYNLPDDPEIYVHRSGRTGRAGRSGISISIIHSREQNKLRMVEKIVKKQFNRCMVPNGNDICAKQIFALVDRVDKIEVNPDVAPYLDSIYEKLQWLDREQLIQHFVSIEFNRYLEYYKDAPNLNINSEPKRRSPRDSGDERGSYGSDRRSKRSDDNNEGFTKLKINIGNNDKLNPTKLIGVINDKTNNRDIAFGKIDITDTATYFEVTAKFAEQVALSLMGAKVQGTVLDVEYIKGSKGGAKGGRRSDSRSDRGDSRGGSRSDSRGDYKGEKRSDRSYDKKRSNKKRPF